MAEETLYAFIAVNMIGDEVIFYMSEGILLGSIKKANLCHDLCAFL